MTTASVDRALAFLDVGGEMAERMAALDWSLGTLGPPARWPSPLKSYVNLMLSSRQPMFMAWGPQKTWFYNDAFIPILGRKHPWALGQSALSEVWVEAIDVLEPLFAQVFAGEPVKMDDISLELDRTGRLEEAHFSFSYTPVQGADGQIEGLFGVCTETTELFRTEQLRQRSEAQLQAKGIEAQASAERVALALESGAIIGTWVWTVEDNRFLADEQFARSFGLDPLVCRIGMPIEAVMESIHPDDQAQVADAVAEALARGGPYRCEYRVLTHDGFYRWIEASGRVELDADGKAVRFPGVLIDTDERRATEQALRRANDLLRTFMEAVPGVIYAKDLDGRLIMGNGGVARLLGVAEQEFVGRTDMDLLANKAEAAAIMANDRRIMMRGVAETLDEEVAYPDGTYTVWRSVKAPFRDEKGQVIGLVGASIDITAERRATAQLRDREERLQSVLDSVTDGFLGIDGDERIILFNRAAEQHLGMHHQAALGQRFWELFPDAVGGPLESAIRRAVESQQPVQVEVASLRRPGRQMEVRIAPKRGGGLAISFSDVTERHESERHRDLLVNELNHRVKNTLAIVQATAHQSLRRSDLPGEVRDGFMARIGALAAAHDILTRRNWESVLLQELLRTTLGPFRQTGRIDLRGPDLRLSAKTAVSFSLAVHELATNAAKYGALSAEGGRVSVAWIVSGSEGGARLKLRWREQGGPAVTAPAKRGFGSRMIETALASELHGEVTMDFARPGLICTIDAPLPDGGSPTAEAGLAPANGPAS